MQTENANAGAEGPNYATFGQRATAQFLDGLIIGLPSQAIILPLLGKPRLQLVAEALLLVFWAWYAIYCVARWGGTPGKLLVKTRIALVDGSPATLRAAAWRASVEIGISALAFAYEAKSLLQQAAEPSTQGLLEMLKELNERQQQMPGYWVLQGLGYTWAASELITMLFNRKRRAVHDFIAGTVVLSLRPPVSRVTTSTHLGTRVLSRSLDVVVVTVVSYGLLEFSAAANWPRLGVLTVFAFGATYVVYPVVRWGGTPCKLLFRTHIELDDGAPVPLSRALLRASVDLTLLLAVFYFQTPLDAFGREFLWAIGMRDLDRFILAYAIWLGLNTVTMLFTESRRSLYDFLAGTLVVRR